MSPVLSIVTHCLLVAVVFATTRLLRLPSLSTLAGLSRLSMPWKGSKPGMVEEDGNDPEAPKDDHVPPQELLKTLQGDHELTSALRELIEKDGAGEWPPRTDYDHWPRSLRPYKEIYLELAPLLSTADPSLDDAVNTERRTKYRSLMRKLLDDRIDLDHVEELMKATEAGDWTLISRDVYNGFYCAVALLRHAYRWATIPVVKVAQLEKMVDFPPELDMPWPYLQRNFGCTADSGNVTANLLHNLNAQGERVFKINIGMSEKIVSSEEAFFRMFYDVEVLAYPVYYEMVRAVLSYEANDKTTCLERLRNVTARVRNLVSVFYQNLNDAMISREVWLSYCQGFQGWGVGRMIDGEFIKYDGLSGNHVLAFQAIDAFLGMDRYLFNENMIRYIPARQRELTRALKKHSLRQQVKENGDVEIEAEIVKVVNHMRVFRAAHRARVMPYLLQPAPERLVMTAGKSVLENDSTSTVADALKPLDEFMVARLRQTV